MPPKSEKLAQSGNFTAQMYKNMPGSVGPGRTPGFG
jgi:hypothetical protein